ncbi:sodium--dicarboxylate symporter [Phlyctochytrium arcticum]|nr:sodium--dicarboxylate symporter [Phlyctochytrium arcticum]
MPVENITTGAKARSTLGTIYYHWSRIHLLVWILIFSIIGVICGLYAPSFSKNYLALLSTHIFLPMVKSLIVPLIFSLLVTGIAGHSDDIAKVGKLGIKSMVYFMSLTVVAIFIGLLFGNIIKPGVGITLDSVKPVNATEKKEISLASELNAIIPTSFFKAASDNQSLQITFCAIMFAVAYMLVKEKRGKITVMEFFEGIVQIMLSLTNMVMRFTPVAIGGALAKAVASNGIGILGHLAKLIGCVYLGLTTFVLLVLLPVALVAKVPLVPFGKAVAKPLMIAFSTASSDAALGIAMSNMMELGVPRQIVSFVIPLGYSFNLDGTTLYLGTAMLFAAQVAGVNWTFSEQLLRMFLVLLMSKGIAGVPRASLVVLAAACEAWGLPAEIVPLVLGIDEINDMARTGVNLLGNCMATVVIAKWEGEFVLYQKEPSVLPIGEHEEMEQNNFQPDHHSAVDVKVHDITPVHKTA